MSKHINPILQPVVDLLNATAKSDRERLDANEAAFLENALEDMKSRVFAEEYAPTKARSFIPVSQDVDPGADTFAYEEEDYNGSAIETRNYADDPPGVDVESEKIILPIVGVINHYFYSIQDLRAAALAGKPLQARRARAARDAWERKMDSIAATGSAKSNLGGFINNTNVNAANATTGTWSGATADQIVTDVSNAAAAMVTASKETQFPNTLILPTAQYLLISQKRMDTTTQETVRQAILNSNPWITRIDSWNTLVDAGVGTTDRAVLFNSSPDVAEMIVPQDFEILPPQVANYRFKVLTHGRTGGTAVYRPLGMRYMDNI